MKVSSAVLTIILQVIISSYCVVAYYPQDEDFIRSTKFGRVQGTSTQMAQVYLGIRFAAPALRWTPRVNPAPWSDIIDVTQLKPMCYQSDSCTGQFPIECVPEKSEDCLYLNIYAPLGTTRKSRKAVMVYIHGGGFDSGSAGGLVYNAEVLAQKGDVIVVTFNYRLGAFGFLVTGNASGDITGNYGIMDQRQALKWVNQNIQYFGGNRFKKLFDSAPSLRAYNDSLNNEPLLTTTLASVVRTTGIQVTLFGQSAGATCAAIHLISEKVDRYFHRVILQSTPFTIPLKNLGVAIGQGVTFGAIAGCLVTATIVNATCLRSLPADAIALIQGRPELRVFPDNSFRSFLQWIPHIDGNEIKSDLIQGLLTGSFREKQIIIGTVQEEGLLYILPSFTEPLNGLALPVVVSQFIPNVQPTLFGLYPVADILDARDELSDMTTDYIFACPARLVARELSKRMKVYSYVFDEALSFFPLLFFNATYCADEPCHGIDIPFVFQSARIPPLVFDAGEFALSDTMIDYWSNFAWYGNVNRGFPSATEWLKYVTEGPTADTIMGLRTPEVSTQIGYRSEVCDLWDIVGYT